MITAKQKILMLLQSTVSLIVAFTLLLLVKWMLVLAGSWFSGFSGKIEWNGLTISALSKTWNLKQVLGIYLFPYLGFIILYFLVSIKRRLPLKISSRFHLFYGWFYLLLLVTVFLIPVAELFNKHGIYYALSWLYFYRLEKILFVVILIILFSLRVFRVAPVFSSSLIVRPFGFIEKGIVFKQLLFLWYIPYLLLFISVIIFPVSFSYSDIYLLAGVLIVLLINTPLIACYKVIIK